MAKSPSFTALLRDLRAFYKTDARAHLPWRQTRDPYRILVSELMLQQTQVDRVVPFYERFIKKYPTAAKLARAKLPEVLALWQGLGYNRRAKYLWACAQTLCSGKMNTTPTPPQNVFASAKLPGVGPYTRGAVMAFAFNSPEVFIETNIRTVFFHYLGGNRVLSDAQLMPLVAEALKRSKMQPRDFYAALMDYGSHLKRQGVRLNHRSAHYARQSKFEGSARQLRGAIVRELLKLPATSARLSKNLSRSRGEVERELTRLAQEGLLLRRASSYRVRE